MYLTVHGAAALFIARAIPNPFVSFGVGLASHFIIDLVPHGDEHIIPSHLTRPKKIRRLMGAALLDGIILAGFLILYLWLNPTLSLNTVLACLVGSLLPDFLQGLYFVTEAGWLKMLNKFHIKIHNLPGSKLNWRLGMLIQVLTFMAFWLLII
jgi:hypothetical protein